MIQTSDTPRTDTAERYVYGRIDRKWVTADFARLLERELNAAKSSIEALKEYAEHVPTCSMTDPCTNNPCTCGLSKLLEEINP